LFRTNAFTLIGLLFLTILPASAAKKEIIRLQADVSILQQQVRALKKDFDSEIAVLRALVEKLYDQSGRVQASLEQLRSFNQQNQATVGAKVESMDTQFSVVNTGIDMVMGRINKLSIQLAETKTHVEALDAPSRAGGPVTPEELYNSAYGDFIKGSYDLARQGFQEYVNHYPDTELSDNALYWVGETFYVDRKFDKAVDAFDRVIQLYPKGDKAAATILKKGFSYLELKNNKAGIKELRWLIRKYPSSNSAKLAKARLKSMGVTVAVSRRRASSR